MKRGARHALEGDLRTFPPALLLQMMQLGALSGLLRVRRPRRGEVRIYFRKGKLVLARDDKQEALGTELVQRGLVDRAVVDEAALEQEGGRKGRRLGTVLVERGSISREDLEDLIRERFRNVIFALVGSSDGRFTFEPDDLPDDEDVLLDMPLESILLEGMKRLDDSMRRGEKSRA